MSTEEEAVEEAGFKLLACELSLRAALPESEEESRSQSEISSSVSSVVTIPPAAEEPLKVPREAVCDDLGTFWVSLDGKTPLRFGRLPLGLEVRFFVVHVPCAYG